MALTSVCSDYFFEKCLSLPHVRWYPVPAILWCGLQGFAGSVGTLIPAVWGNSWSEAKGCGVNAPLNEGWGINSDKNFISAKTTEKLQLEQVGQPQDARLEETSLCEFWHLQC